jgi:PAS domain S-box-containing protein
MSIPRILLLEDSPLDAELALAALKDGGLEVEATVVASREKYVLALTQMEFDVILADYALPDITGFEALHIAKASAPHVPFIYVSGTLGEDRAIDSIHEGATDYVLKQNLKRLAPATHRALKIKRDRDTFKATADALHESEIRFQQVIESINEYAIIALDLNGCIRSWNSGAERVIGLKEDEVIGQHFRLFFTDEDNAAQIPEKELTTAQQEGRAEDERWQLRWVSTADGKRTELMWASGIVTPIVQDGRVTGFTKIFRDQTKEKRSEEEHLRLTHEIDQERYRLNNIIDSIPGVVWELKTSDGIEHLYCSFISPYIERMTGYTPEEWITIHQPPRHVIVTHPDDIAHVNEAMQRIWSTGSDDVIQHRWITKDGSVTWLESFVSPVHENGRIAGLRGVSLDISRRKEIEEERDLLLQNVEQSHDKIALLLQSVEESEQRYKTIAEAMPVIVWSTDAEGKVDYLNERWVQFTGVSREESYKLLIDDFIHPDDRATINARWTEAANDGSEFQAELRLRNKEGIFEWFLSRAVAVRGENGKLIQWIGTSTPLNEQKRSRENLRLLAVSSEILASSLDYETTLRSVAQLAVPSLADWCTVDMVNAEGKLERLAVANVDPEKIKWSYELEKKYPSDPNAPTGVPNVIRTGKSEFYPNIPRELLIASARDEEHMRIIDEIGFTSAMTVPLVARDFVVGAMTFVAAESGRHYTEEDLALAEDIGRRAGVAIDNAWLYRKAQEELEERKRAEEEVRMSETRFRALVEQSPLAIQIYAKDGYCLQANRAWEQLFDTPRKSLEGYNILDDQEAIKNGMQPYIARAFKGESVAIPPAYYDPASNKREGRPRWLRSFMYPIKQAEDVREVAVILEDVTDRLEFEDALRKAKEAAEAANQAKDKFLAILSHELRTPLTPVLTTVQILEMDENFPAEYRGWLDIIHRNVELEARLIDDLLDLTRISKGKLKLNREKIDVHRLIEHVVEIYRGEIENKKLNVRTDLSATKSVVSGDPARLQQVLWNLFKNAVKFTPQGGTISIRSSNEGDLLHLEVEDTGIGIDPTVLPRIFDAFEQGEQTVTRHFGGLGLGLAISKNLVDLHGGRISAKSRGRNKGATFCVDLPTMDGEGVVSAPLEKIHANGNPGKTSTSILLVDDHMDTSLALKLLLERRGFEVTTANTVESGLEAIRKRTAAGDSFEIVISDIGLPDGSGLDLMAQLKRQDPSAKAIALSGFGTDEDIRRSKEAGFEEHLTKPFSFQKLEEVVRRLLS